MLEGGCDLYYFDRFPLNVFVWRDAAGNRNLWYLDELDSC